VAERLALEEVEKQEVRAARKMGTIGAF